VLSLVGLSFQIAKRSTSATDQALSMGLQIAGADRAVTVPFDSLSQFLTPDTVWSGAARVTVRYVITSVSTVRSDVYVITSTTVAGSNEDTTIIQRGRIRYPIPLK
jgi:hypothetical protein